MATQVLTADQQKAVNIGDKVGGAAVGFAVGVATNSAAAAASATVSGVANSMAAASWLTAHGAPTLAHFAAAAASAKAKSLAITGLGGILGGTAATVLLPLAGAYVGAKLVEWWITSGDD